MALFEKPLFTLEIANNHQGSVEHGKRIIRECAAVAHKYKDYFDFAMKFQYRDLDSFIREDYRNRDDVKNVKRFKDTRLTEEQFLELKAEVEKNGMFTMCTPFDEASVAKIARHGFDIIKIASCSFGDWPLMEAIAETNLPVIASTAASSLEEIDNVVMFFKHRNNPLSLMHCIAEYPTAEDHLEMNQIDLLKGRYPQLLVGFSTHEDPSDMEPVKIAVAKGAVIFERHVGVPTDTITLNAYSSTPRQIDDWCAAALCAFKMCGKTEGRYIPSEKEKADLAALQRGVFAKRDLQAGEILSQENICYAFPCEAGQLLSKHLSKYNEFILKHEIKANSPVYIADTDKKDTLGKIINLVQKVEGLLLDSHAVVPVNSTCEISHHYGLERYEEIGVAIINCINREYCKKLLVVLPGQHHPTHFHKKKEETFTVLYGELDVECNGKKTTVRQGESMVVERGVKHSFGSKTGCVFEEISTTHYKDDSFYDKAAEFVNPRKTKIYLANPKLTGQE